MRREMALDRSLGQCPRQVAGARGWWYPSQGKEHTERYRFRCSEIIMQYYFNSTSVTVHLEKMEFTPQKGKWDLLSVLAKTLEGLTKPAVS